MQCASCTKTLPTSARFCFFCGTPVASAGQDASGVGIEAIPAPAAQGEAVQDTPSFALREFGNASLTPPGGAPDSLAGMPVPLFAAPAVAGAVAQANIPPGPSSFGTGVVSPAGGSVGSPMGAPFVAAPGAVPYVYPFPAVQGTYAPPVTPPKRRGRSMGWIVLYAFLAIILLFTGLGFALHAFGSYVQGTLSAQQDAKRAAAMQLYRQVTGQHPVLQDPLDDSSANSWQNFDETTYGCTKNAAGLRVYITDAAHFVPCLDTSISFTNIALQIQMRILTGDAGGLVFRVARTPDNSASLYFFQITSAGVYSLALDQDVATAKVSRLATGTTSAMNKQAGQTNTLTLIVQGDTFDLYINQQYLTQVQDATLATGGIGVLAADASSSTSVIYSNATFWSLE